MTYQKSPLIIFIQLIFYYENAILSNEKIGRKKKKQANNFIIDLTNSNISFEEVNRQIESIYISKRFLWIDKILIIKGENVIRIYKRMDIKGEGQL